MNIVREYSNEDARTATKIAEQKNDKADVLGDPRLNQRFGFRVPDVYKTKILSVYQHQRYLEDFMKLARDLDYKDHMFGEWKVRRLWAGAFMNNSLEECAESLRILRRQVEIGLKAGGEQFVMHASNGGWSFAAPDAHTISEFTCRMHSPFQYFSKGETIVITNMTGGLTVTPLVIEKMKQMKLDPVGYALIGFSNQGQTPFEDGSRMEREFFVHPLELKTLVDNTNKVALVVDDSHRRGEAFTQVVKNLKRIGYRKVYKVVGQTAELVDGDDYYR